MNKIKLKILLYVVFSAVGIALLCLGASQIADPFYSGMGGGLIGVSVIRLIQLIRFDRDKEYAKRITVEISDERNLYISSKARSMAYYIGILVLAAATVVLRIMGRNELSTMCGFVICLFLVLYYILYLIYRKNG